MQNQWCSLQATANGALKFPQKGSVEEFITEHYLGILQHAQRRLHRISRSASAVEGATVRFFKIRRGCPGDLRKRSRRSSNENSRFSIFRGRIFDNCVSGQKII